jgi:uncharacterized protein with ParB-like and HNH nuclease domain
VKAILGYNYYCIPRFQRPYSWLQENIADYWNDTIAESEVDYFIGSMVVYKIDGDTYGVVDGQQRLTTITMLLCAIRNMMKTKGFDDLALGVHRFVERPNIDNKQEYILSTETSYPYFQEHIQKFGEAVVAIQPKQEETNLASAFQQIQAFVEASVSAIETDPTISKDLKPEKIREKLTSIRDKILSPKLIFVELDTEDDAYIVFETMNTRGKDLNVADLVKNHLAKLIKPANISVDTVKIQWERVVSTIEGSSADIRVETFLHHYWLSQKDYVTVKKLFKEIKKSVKKSNAQSFLNDLEKDAVTYREINETSAGKWEKNELSIKGSLDAMFLFKVKQEIPMVFSIMRDYKKGIIKNKDAANVLRAIENFHFVFTAITSQRSSGGISQMYASSAKNFATLKTREDKLKIIKELCEKIGQKIPSYQEFEANFMEICYTNNITKQKSLIKYVLSKIHAVYTKDTVTNYDLMTIEHILPQSKIGHDGYTDKEIGQLGNLILIPQELNGELGDKEFLDKRGVLEQNGVFLDEKVREASTWEREQIEDRTKWMAKLAYDKIWKIE